jgi:hypothetical protein
MYSNDKLAATCSNYHAKYKNYYPGHKLKLHHPECTTEKTKGSHTMFVISGSVFSSFRMRGSSIEFTFLT